MTQKTPAQSQPHHQKKNSYCVMEDIHGVIMVPKEESHLQLQLHPLSHKKPSHCVPDLGLALQLRLLGNPFKFNGLAPC
ncbi:hypothetical protein OROHE_004375 [Orobanche hederae]